MEKTHNDNANVNVSQKTKGTMTMNNDNDIVKRNFDKSKHVDIVALRLIDKWGVDKEQYWSPMCKIAWRLPEHLIWDNYEKAQKGKNPMGLFMWLCGRSGA